MPDAISNTSAAGLEVWGTLKLLLEAKSSNTLKSAGMWISSDVQQRISNLAGE
jgi:hypothetical protein